MLAERGIFGMLWVDDALCVSAKYGRLVDFIEVGQPLVAGVFSLSGMEADIRALKSNPDSIIDMPSVALVDGSAQSPKINIAVHWSQEEGCVLVVLTRLSTRSNLEFELSRQMRARLIAESEVIHKSKELAKANADLARANRDLEEFAAIITHDLKAPMRTLRYLGIDLEQELGERASPKARVTLQHMQAQSQRMSEMMSALLDYASAGRKEEVAEPVDTEAMVHAITRSMLRRPGFKIEIAGGWPQVFTLRAPLDLALRNLIDNAMKHHDRDAGSAHVSCTDRGHALEIRVADDGPGIAPSEHAAAFLPFRRLLRAGGEGQGIGLALVKRWVESAGGTLKIESNPSVKRGATFVLLWPKFDAPRESAAD
jgi:signal transduction histidine kinase